MHAREVPPLGRELSNDDVEHEAEALAEVMRRGGNADRWFASRDLAAPDQLAIIAALSIAIGNLVALAQTNVRRLLAYSAVAHAGYALLGIVSATADGFGATLFYSTVYGITLVGAFAVVGWVRRETGGDMETARSTRPATQPRNSTRG